MEKGPEILACDPGAIKIHIRIMQMENQLWIRACFGCAQLVYLNKNFEKAKNIFRFPIEIYMGMCYIICIKYPKKC